MRHCGNGLKPLLEKRKNVDNHNDSKACTKSINQL